jgi:hypothetical protein
MAMNTGFPQQRPLLNSAQVRSAPSQQHGAHMWRSATVPPAEPTVVPKEEKTFGPPLKR